MASMAGADGRHLQETGETRERRKALLEAGEGIRAEGRARHFAAVCKDWQGVAERPGGGPVFGPVWYTFNTLLL